MMKLKDNFWEYEMGAEMISTVTAWDIYLEEKNYESASAMQTRFEAFRISFRYMFGIDVHFNRTDEVYGICDDNFHYYFKDKRWKKPEK